MSVEDGNKPAPRPEAVPPGFLAPNGTHDKVTDAMLEERAKLEKLINSGLAMDPVGAQMRIATLVQQDALKAAINAFDPVNHPKHYMSHPAKCSCGASIECIQVTEHMSFSLGNAMKYLWRADLKGAAIQDLEKAKWYIEREIAKRKAEQA